MCYNKYILFRQTGDMLLPLWKICFQNIILLLKQYNISEFVIWLFVCLNSSETVQPKELKFLRDDSPWVANGFRLKNIRIFGWLKHLGWLRNNEWSDKLANNGSTCNYLQASCRLYRLGQQWIIDIRKQPSQGTS